MPVPFRTHDHHHDDASAAVRDNGCADDLHHDHERYHDYDACNVGHHHHEYTDDRHDNFHDDVPIDLDDAPTLYVPAEVGCCVGHEQRRVAQPLGRGDRRKWERLRRGFIQQPHPEVRRKRHLPHGMGEPGLGHRTVLVHRGPG